MYSSTHRHHIAYSDLSRWSARLLERFYSPAGLVRDRGIGDVATGHAISEVFYQAAALAIVFLGYLVGWRDELLGGLFAILGTAAYFLVVVLTVRATAS